MTINTQYTKFRPQRYQTRVPIFWWVHKWAHLRFITRELTSVFVAIYAFVLLFQLWALNQGAETYALFLAWLRTPISIGLHMVALLFVIFHSITWFNLAPKALVLRLGTKRVPDAVLIVLNYLAWGVLSVVIAWIMLKA
ncbi:MAG: fumarate reductase subunit C [Ignavibacteriae bacterium]|nr:fumarate reductase subunit C [Ignavibacteriota bacterium]